MPKITILSQQLVNKIAAGEVVERPASIVKELLENSFDAGAARVAVEIEDGGKKLIRVSDDGCGIPADELALAVAPHATSKIAQEEDLYAIATFGFRGEALASIASVSQMEIISRPHDAIAGARLEIAGGRIQPVAPASAPAGTVLSVGNLFFNTPARRKFLRTASTELGHITEQFTRIALAHTGAQLTLTHNSRALYEMPARQSLRERIAVLFSRDLADSLIAIQRNDRGVTIHGLIAPPQQSRPSSQHQYIFLNDRHIRDRFITHAIREAYRGLMEINRQPVVFLFITLPPDRVDVNVHPAKTEVRFADSNTVHSQVLAAIRDQLLGSDLSVPMRSESLTDSDSRYSHPPAVTEVKESPTQRQERIRQAMADFFKSTPPPSSGAGPNQYPSRTPFSTHKTPTFRQPAPISEPVHPPAKTSASSAAAAPTEPTVPPGHRFTSDESDTSGPKGAPLNFLQIHNSYLITESDEGVLIIDQHALHERVIFEKLYAQLNQGPLASQRCLIPETLDVTAEQLAAWEEACDIFEQLGIIIEQFGPRSLAVQGFPCLLDKVSPSAFVADLLDLLIAQAGRVNREELLHHLLDVMACKAAVKAGDPLCPDEISSLLAQRHLIDRAGKCPHGRPTTIRLTLSQLEKQFKRI